MNIISFSLLYGCIGLGCGIATYSYRRTMHTRPLELMLVVIFWPLYGPFLLSRVEPSPGESASAPSEVVTPFLQALERAQHTPLATLLPDHTTGMMLANRLQAAADQVYDIDRLLAQPDFSEELAHKRQSELEAQGNHQAAATVQSRRASIKRLQNLRDRFAHELDDITELLAKLRIQAEVVRIAGELDEGTRDLMSHLMSRVEGLEEVLFQGWEDEERCQDSRCR